MPLRAQQSAVPSSAPSSSSASSTAAQPDNSKALNDKLADLDKRVTAAQSSGDNAWMLVVFCYVMVTRVKAIFGYDDALDAFGVHGAGGTIGALLTGVFAQQVINPIFGAGKPVGGLDGHWGQTGNHLVGIAIAWGFALVGTIVILKITDLVTGFRVAEEQQVEGLDITQHGEEAYYLES